MLMNMRNKKNHALSANGIKIFWNNQKRNLRNAFCLWRENKIKYPFNRVNEFAGSNWFKGFLLGYPELSLRIPKGI